MEATRTIWMNGDLVEWDDARIHVGCHGLHYGSGVFEGIRCYETPRGAAVFRLADHLERLERSARILHMPLPYDAGELAEATLDLLAANGLGDCYVRPIAFYGYGTLGVPPRRNPVYVAIMSWPWGAYLGEDAGERGARLKVSSWRRVGPNVIPHAAKATGAYLNSVLAVGEAHRAGYDEALLLTEAGEVGDCSGEHVFAVGQDVLRTPELSASILPGITRDTVATLARDLGCEVRAERMIRSDLVTADEVFLCGTAAEVTPVRSVDDHELGGPGPVTRAIGDAYRRAVSGLDGRYASWLEPVPALARTDG